MAKYLIILSFPENLSIKCSGCVLEVVVGVALYSLPTFAKLSAFTQLSIIGLKSNIPAPALLGVVLNVPTTSVVKDKLGARLELICTSATNFTLI